MDGGGHGGSEEELTAQETALYDLQIRVWGVDVQNRLDVRLCIGRVLEWPPPPKQRGASAGKKRRLRSKKNVHHQEDRYAVSALQKRAAAVATSSPPTPPKKQGGPSPPPRLKEPYSTPDEVLDNSASGIKEEGAINSVNAAKVAAMIAAELVNRNVVAFGVGTRRLSTDQNKRLLWGNKKSNPS